MLLLFVQVLTMEEYNFLQEYGVGDEESMGWAIYDKKYQNHMKDFQSLAIQKTFNSSQHYFFLSEGGGGGRE